jgi:hypothetical protein
MSGVWIGLSLVLFLSFWALGTSDFLVAALIAFAIYAFLLTLQLIESIIYEPDSPAELDLGRHWEWDDFFATADPVPNGPLFGEATTARAISQRVNNTGNAFTSHGGYWSNMTEFVPHVAQLISDGPTPAARELYTPLSKIRAHFIATVRLNSVYMATLVGSILLGLLGAFATIDFVRSQLIADPIGSQTTLDQAISDGNPIVVALYSMDVTGTEESLPLVESIAFAIDATLASQALAKFVSTLILFPLFVLVLMSPVRQVTQWVHLSRARQMIVRLQAGVEEEPHVLQHLESLVTAGVVGFGGIVCWVLVLTGQTVANLGRIDPFAGSDLLAFFIGIVISFPVWLVAIPPYVRDVSKRPRAKPRWLVHDIVVGLISGIGLGGVAGLIINLMWEESVILLLAPIVGAIAGVYALIYTHRRSGRFLTWVVVVSWVLLIPSAGFIALVVWAAAQVE